MALRSESKEVASYHFLDIRYTSSFVGFPIPSMPKIPSSFISVAVKIVVIMLNIYLSKS